MNFLLVAFGWSILFIAVTLARPNPFNSKQSVQNKKETASVPADDKCSIVVNGDYYAGPNKEIQTILQGIQTKLSEMQEQLGGIKTAKVNKTGKRKRNIHNCNFISLIYLIIQFQIGIPTRSSNVKTKTKCAGFVFIVVDAFSFTLKISEKHQFSRHL